MQKFVQRGLLGVLLAGGITLCGATAANAATADGPTGQGSESGQSNSVVDVVSGNALGGLSAGNPVTTVNGNTVNIGSGGNTTSGNGNTTVHNGSDNDAKAEPSTTQSNDGDRSGSNGGDQQNDATSAGSGNAVGGVAVANPVTTVNGNTVNIGGGDAPRHSEDGKPAWKGDRDGSEDHGNTTIGNGGTVVDNGSGNTATAEPVITQSNSAEGDHQPSHAKHDRSDGTDQQNTAEQTLTGNAVGGVAVANPVTTVNGNTLNAGGHGGNVTKDNGTTEVSNGSGNTATAHPVITQSNTAKDDHQPSHPGHDSKKGKDSHSEGTDQKNSATQFLSGNAIGGIAVLNPVTTVNGNTLNAGGHGGNVTKDNGTTEVSNGSGNTATAHPVITQSNTAKDDHQPSHPAHDAKKGKDHHSDGTDQSNSATQFLSGNAIGGIAVGNPVTTVNGNTFNAGDDRYAGHQPQHQPKHQPGSRPEPAEHGGNVTKDNGTTEVSNGSGNTATAHPVITQSNTAKDDHQPSHTRHECEARGSSAHQKGVDQRNSATQFLSGNAIGGIAVANPVTTVNGNTLNAGGHGGNTTEGNGTTEVSNGSGNTATAHPVITQSNGTAASWPIVH